MKTTPVSIYIDDVLVGSGEIAYNDASYETPLGLRIYHCDETIIYIDDRAFTLKLCWDDIVSDYSGGIIERQLWLPVYLDDIVAGSASIRISDSFAQATIICLLPILISSLMVIVIVKLLRTSSTLSSSMH